MITYECNICGAPLAKLDPNFYWQQPDSANAYCVELQLQHNTMHHPEALLALTPPGYPNTPREQIKIYKDPHSFEGLVYDTDWGPAIFCQVGRQKFCFICLTDGNRISEPKTWCYDSETSFEFLKKLFYESDALDAPCIGRITQTRRPTK